MPASEVSETTKKNPAADWDKCKIGPRYFGNFKPGKKGHRVCSEDVASDVLFLFPNWPGFFICFCSRNNSSRAPTCHAHASYLCVSMERLLDARRGSKARSRGTCGFPFLNQVPNGFR